MVEVEPCILVRPNSYLRGYVVRAATCGMQQTIFLEEKKESHHRQNDSE
jgi:hypothetical protein